MICWIAFCQRMRRKTGSWAKSGGRLRRNFGRWKVR